MARKRKLKDPDEIIAHANEKLEALNQKREEIQEEIKTAKRAKAEAKRAEDTRRKILVGAMYLGKLDNGQIPPEQFYGELDSYLTKEVDRKLFGLDQLDQMDEPDLIDTSTIDQANGVTPLDPPESLQNVNDGTRH